VNPEPIDLTDCVCDPAGACQGQTNRVIIQNPGMGIVRVAIATQVNVNWNYFKFDCDFTGAPPNTDVSCVIEDGDQREVLWTGSSGAYGENGPVDSGQIVVGDYMDKRVDIVFEVKCENPNGGDIVIANPVFSQDPSYGTPSPPVPLPDIPEVVVTEPGGSTARITLQCPPCEPPGEDSTEYIWIVDGNYCSGEVTIEIELEIGIHTISLCLVDKFSRQACAEEEVEVVAGEMKFLRGDANASNVIDIADVVFTLSYLFAQGTPPSCLDAGDANDSGAIDIADAIALLSHLFAHTGPLNPPFGACGPDPTEDSLACLEFKLCQQ
jgi:hypothetical protein